MAMEFKRRRLTPSSREAYSFAQPHTPEVLDAGMPMPPSAFPQRVADETPAAPQAKFADGMVISLHAFEANKAEPEQVEALDAI